MRYLFLCLLFVGCVSPREPELPDQPPSWHPEHDINKQPHQWKTATGRRSFEEK